LGQFLESDGDPDLIIFIPFTASVKLKSISIIGGKEGTSPRNLKA
jgi:hypothetical protein